MDDKKKKNEESLSRRSFLTSLGKWSSIVVATAVLGISEASGSEEVPKEAGAAREGIPGHDVAHDESMESQWWRWRRRLRRAHRTSQRSRWCLETCPQRT